jgi:hypothetical protein
VSREAQAIVLVLLGATLLHAGATDLYLRYVKAGLQPLLLAAGAALVIAAIATAWHEWRPQKATKKTVPAPAKDAQNAQQAHSHREPRICWLLLLPLLCLLPLVAPAQSSLSDRDHERVRAAVARGEMVPLAQVLADAQRRHPGTVLEVELEDDEYEVQILGDDGVIRELEYDARTGHGETQGAVFH